MNKVGPFFIEVAMSFPKSAASKRNRRRYMLANHWILITSRTVNGRFWFSEFDERDRELVFELLIVAMLRYGVDCAGFVLMSGHVHLLCRSKRGGKRISLAIQYLLAGIARLVHTKHGTSGPVWQRGFTAVNLLDNEAERSSLVYICEHGVAQGLVSRPQAWPLPNTVEALLGDRQLEGLFPDRADPSKLRKVRARLSPLTQWHHSSEKYAEVCAAIVDDIIAGASSGLSPEISRRLDHAYVPPKVKRSPLRIFKAGSDLREELLAQAYTARREAVDAAIAAAGLLMRRGIEAAELPPGCQWPPFVSEALEESLYEMPFSAVYAPPDSAAA